MLNFIKIRKYLHQIPELAFEEFKTKEYLLKILKMLKDIKIHTFDFPGILVEYSHGKGEYTLFRSDMDALPITEETGCDFASEHPGKMHACGHDMHMTILLGLIEKVSNERIEQNILFLFQPAEEGKGGAKRILDTGTLDKFPIKETYALHVKGDIPVGTVSTKPGIFFANTEEVDIVFTGIGAHVALADRSRFIKRNRKKICKRNFRKIQYKW
jgi:N-acetyldiaminopimelate deacetylase